MNTLPKNMQLNMTRSALIVFQPYVLLVVAVLSTITVNVRAELPDVRRIVFLGDSITYAGGYVASLEAAAIVRAPDRHIEFINLGLPSETVSGLSELGHADGRFPRPDLHERLARVLEQTKPDLVVACYGMNDGIYYPLSEERFEKFKTGIERLHGAVTGTKASIIHLTPAYFDALPIQARLLPAGLDEYRQPYAGYDDVLDSYSQWLMSKRNDDWQVIDIHGAMRSAVLRERKRDPSFTFAGDGVHPNAAGQAVIARQMAEAWGLKLDERGLPEHPQAEKLVSLISEKQQVLKHAWLSQTKHTRPGIIPGLPLPDAMAKADELDRAARALLAQ